MKWIEYGKIAIVCCLTAIFCGCEENDSHRGYLLSARWFGDLGMMVDGQKAVESDLDFVPDDYGDYTQGYGYETDYYYTYGGRMATVEHNFTWMVRNGMIYLRFDDPDLDCDIRDYSLSSDYFKGYMDGIYSSTWFTLRNYDRYWNQYGYYGDSYSYRRGIGEDSLSVESSRKETPKCVRMVNMKSEVVPQVQ
ncbi:MAG: hypothetical protein LUC45_03260 [Paraprevotella sp.]|nr:hypothetical protein [Paraprevotella sp.]